MRSAPTQEFPPQVSKVFEALREEVTFLHANWDAYQQLFGTAESIAVLNEIASGAFQLVRRSLRHEMIMAFSRITDPKATGFGKKARENLTLKQLLHVVGQHCSDAAFLDQLAAQEQAIEAHCKPIRDLRNRRVGHLDLQTAMKYHPDPLPNVGKEHVDVALRLLAVFMNDVLGHYRTYAHADFVPLVTGPARNIVQVFKLFKKQLDRGE